MSNATVKISPAGMLRQYAATLLNMADGLDSGALKPDAENAAIVGKDSAGVWRVDLELAFRAADYVTH